MCDNLKRFHVITSSDVENGFRSVDRRLFVPKGCEELAYKDQPIREGNIHISAPHIYGSVLEALDLKKDADISFLNAGSGTCYLTCIAASILGPRSVHYCVDICEDVINHARTTIASWKKHEAANVCKTQNIELFTANALELNINKGECALGFDRVYIGAAIEKKNLNMFKNMLKPGGVLVGPVDDELVKIVRSHVRGPALCPKFTTQVLSGVRFAPLLVKPSIQTIIPARVWDPSNHHLYPNSFRGACRELLMCSIAKKKQPVTIRPKEKLNAASMLPRALWVEVLSFANRDWFDAPLTEVDFLRSRLSEEQTNVIEANRAKEEAEARCRTAERERDMYRVLARTLRTRLSAISQEASNDAETVEAAAAAAMLFDGMELSTFGLQRMLRQFRTTNSEANDEEMEVYNSETTEDDDEMSEDTDGISGEDYDENSSVDDDSLSFASGHQDSLSNDAGNNPDAINSNEHRPQVRTISLGDEDM